MDQIPEWFETAITTGMSRLYGARLNFSPNDGDEVKANTATWMEVLWLNPPAGKWHSERATTILAVFGRLASSCTTWPTIAEFNQEWAVMREDRNRPSDAPRLPAPELTEKQQARIREIRDEIASEQSERSAKAATDNRLFNIGEALHGIVRATTKEPDSLC